ncbi:MAG: enoyl-CoA hydratase/isomerase family protein [Nitrospirae bacterium]|nr:enoyl-CoA hydratase/isomerase family protein [Nitrospirota bacterium]
MANINVEKRGAVLRLTFNRPEALNAVNQATIGELEHAVGSLRDDPDVRVAILTGSGEKAFVAGADIRELPVGDVLKSRPFAERMQRLTRDLETCGKPVIAAVNGYALGGGMEIVLACTIRLASEKAKFGLPEINLGIMPGWGGTQRLSRIVGVGRALAWTLTGDHISAQEALQMGLVAKVVPPERLQPEADEWADRLVKKSAPALQCIMQAVRASAELPIDRGLELEANLLSLLLATPEAAEGIRAFLEKRK